MTQKGKELFEEFNNVVRRLAKYGCQLHIESPQVKVIEAITDGEFSKCIKNQICFDCGKKVKNFRDEISKKEYQISALCQECQDIYFKESDTNSALIAMWKNEEVNNEEIPY